MNCYTVGSGCARADVHGRVAGDTVLKAALLVAVAWRKQATAAPGKPTDLSARQLARSLRKAQGCAHCARPPRRGRGKTAAMHPV